MSERDKLNDAIAEGLKLRAENARLKKAIVDAIDTLLLVPGSSEPETWWENAREILERSLQSSPAPGNRRLCPVCGMPWNSADNTGPWRCPRCNSEIPAGE